MLDPYFLFFFIPLSWFATMFFIEAGSIVMIPICRYEQYREKMLYVLGAMWAIIATSLVYLVVTLDTVYAPVLYVTGLILYVPLMLVIILLGFHHFFIGTAEGAGNLGDEKREKLLLYVALPFALAVAYSGVTLFTTVFSGIGFEITNAKLLLKGLSAVLSAGGFQNVNYQTVDQVLAGSLAANYVEMYFNPFNIVFFLAIVFYVVYFTVIFYGIRERLILGALGLTLAHALFLASTATWLPQVFQNAISNAGYWFYVVLTYLMLITVVKNVPFRQMWLVILTFAGGMMFGAFTNGQILVDLVPAGTLGPGTPAGLPAAALLTNPATLIAGVVVLSMAGILVIGGVTSVSYKVLYKAKVKRAAKEAVKV